MKNYFAILFLVALQIIGHAQNNVSQLRQPMTRSEIEAGLMSHDHALFLKNSWIRDPYIVLAPDDYYYLTGTTPNPGDPREQTDPYNKGLGKNSIVGSSVQIWRSKDLVDWEYMGAPYTLNDGFKAKSDINTTVKKEDNSPLWAPELHWVNGRWALIHCPKNNSNLAFTNGPGIKGPWTLPMGLGFDSKHDPSMFRDSDGSWYAIWGNTSIAKFSDDFTHFETEPYYIQPSGSRPDPEDPGKTISRIGHEGCTMLKIGGKYILFGTGWSTDLGRKGTYNLYYCVADKITGTYGPRKFVGRFLGHGTPFQTKDGKWWCTAFYNSDILPISREGVEKRDLSDTAYSINQRGFTIVPLDVKVLKNGEINIRAIDPAYQTPGPEENQKF